MMSFGFGFNLVNRVLLGVAGVDGGDIELPAVVILLMSQLLTFQLPWGGWLSSLHRLPSYVCGGPPSAWLGSHSLIRPVFACPHCLWHCRCWAPQ